MTNLDWFAARDLAMVGGRAIRRSAWRQWLLHRFDLWMISTLDAATGAEDRRIVQNTDFRDSEFLAKDWTDEVWEGGATPPCTTPGVATAPAASATGGLGGWTLAAGQCGGAGQGGNIPAVSYGPLSGNGSGHPATTATLKMVFSRASNLDVPLVPDGEGGTCWVTPPTDIVLTLRIGGDGIPQGVDTHYAMFIAPPGTTLTVPSPVIKAGISGLGDVPTGTLRRWVANLYHGTPPALVPPGEAWLHFGAYRDAYMGVYGEKNLPGQDALIQVTPGGTWNARMVVIQGPGTIIMSLDASYTFALPCGET